MTTIYVLVVDNGDVEETTGFDTEAEALAAWRDADSRVQRASIFSAGLYRVQGDSRKRIRYSETTN